MFWIKMLKNLLGALQSSDSPYQVAFGFALGALLGLSPLATLQGTLLFLILMGTKSNLGAAALATPLFAALALFLDPIAHRIGYALLVQSPSLVPLWTRAYNAPLLPFTHFYNTVVLGEFILGLLLFVPLIFLSRQGVLYYRAHYQEKVSKWKIMKYLQLTKVGDILEKTK